MLGPLVNSPEQTVKVDVLLKQEAASCVVFIISKSDRHFDEVRARVTLTATAQRKNGKVFALEKKQLCRSILFSQEVC